ncbi:MAG: hypothetical protein JWM64_1680, partial [Frankiales bacterium]|nr:hypothetical protein [Frankiales bacterium]
RLPGDSPLTVPGYSKQVSNFGDESFGEVDVVDATVHSVNTAYVTLAAKVGPQAVADVAHAVGIREADRLAEPDGPPSLAIALGVYGVRVVDQATAFATFANHGVAAAPFVVQSVQGAGGTVVYRAQRHTHRALPEDVTADVAFALQQVVERGTASSNGRLDGRPAIGKTGTTQDSRDAWMVGAVPQLSAAVWLGRGDNEPVAGATGGGKPARIWKAVLDAALQGEPARAFPPRAGVGRAPSPSPSPTPSASPTGSPTPSPTPSRPDVVVPTDLPSYAPPTADPAPTRLGGEPTTDPAADPYATSGSDPYATTDPAAGSDAAAGSDSAVASDPYSADSAPTAMPAPTRGGGRG